MLKKFITNAGIKIKKVIWPLLISIDATIFFSERYQSEVVPQHLIQPMNEIVASNNPGHSIIDYGIDRVEYFWGDPYKKLTWQQAMEYVQTPEQAQVYLDRHFTALRDDTLRDDTIRRSFKYNHLIPGGKNCLDYANSAAALLSDDGYLPNYLCMFTEDLENRHAVFLYRTPAGYGALGNTPIAPEHQTVESLVMAFEQIYGPKFKYDRYKIISLDYVFPDGEYIGGDGDLDLGFFGYHYPYIKIKHH